MLGLDGIITDGFNNDFDMPYKVFDDALGSDKIPSQCIIEKAITGRHVL